jgi:hypothetical protein
MLSAPSSALASAAELALSLPSRTGVPPVFAARTGVEVTAA